MKDKKIILIDNYDSFTYNLVHLIEEIVETKVIVKRNDQLTIEEVKEYDYIILSPGPGLPEEAGLLKDIIDRYKDTKKIFGVCLGLQAIAEVFGSRLKNLNRVYHGIQSTVKIDDDSIIFKGLPDQIEVGRYHSWVIDEATLDTDNFKVSSRDSNREIMAIEHKQLQVYAVQFHPESIMTPEGKKMMTNFLSI